MIMKNIKYGDGQNNFENLCFRDSNKREEY